MNVNYAQIITKLIGIVFANIHWKISHPFFNQYLHPDWQLVLYPLKPSYRSYYVLQVLGHIFDNFYEYTIVYEYN